MKRALALTGLLLLAPALAPVRADRLHLAGGGVIETAVWWVEGDTLQYETAEGTVGLPRSLVVRVEETAAPATPPAPGSSSAAAGSPSSTSGESADLPGPNAERAATAGSGTIRVTRELGELLMAAKSALDAGDHETAVERYERALRLADADLHVPRIGYALSQIALDNDDAAFSVVLEGLARDPDEPALLELLGDLYNRKERVPDALESWRSAFKNRSSDRLRQKILKAERELDAGRDYSLTTSPHFNMRYDRHVDAALSREVTEFLEQQYWVLADRFRHSPPQPITVLLYPTREFRDVTQSPEWVGGIYDGKIRVPMGGLRRLNPAAEAVLTHELAHAVIHSKSRGSCPRWLHEGLAQIAEERHLTHADRGRILETLSDRKPARWNDGAFSYPTALSFTLHLQSRKGFDGLVRVLDRLAEGSSLESALESVYRVSYERLCREWAEELGEQAG